MRRLLPVLLAALALAACGSDDEQPAAGAPDSTQLTVEVTGAQPDPITMEFGCGSADCDLGELAKVTEPPAEPHACTQQYGGPEKAHVTGTLEGRPVDVTIDRADGCGIAAYEQLFAALGRKPPLAG